MFKYFSLSSLSTDPCNVNKDWHKQVTAEWVCPRCYNIRSEKINDIVLSHNPDNAPLNIIHGVDLDVISQSFINLIGEVFIEKYLELGRLLNNDRRPIADFFSFRGIRARLLIRGNKDSNHSNCSICNRYNYYPRGNWHLASDEIGVDPLYQSQFGIIVRDDIYDPIKFSKIKKLSIREIPVKP